MKNFIANFYSQIAISAVSFFLLTFLVSPNISLAEARVSNADNTFVMFDDFVSLDRVKLANKFYKEHHSDQYDFLYFFYDSDSGSGADFIPVKSSNTFLSKTKFPFDNSKFYGSTTRLLGTVVDNVTLTKLDRSGFVDTLFFRTLQHELFHYWGVYLPQILSDAACDDAHWVGYIGSHLSCGGDSNNKFFENNNNYFYSTNCFGIPKFNDFELYSMGLKSLADVKEKVVVYNSEKDFINDLKVNSDCDKVTSVPKEYILKSYSIQDFINVLGPSFKQSRNNFNVAFILVKPFGSAVNSSEISSLKWWANKSPIAWYKATDGLSTLNNIVPNDSNKPVISNVKVTKDHSRIDISWQTDKPSVSAISLKNSRFGYEEIIYRSKLSPPEYSITHSISVNANDDSNIDNFGTDDFTVDKIVSIDEQLNVGEYVPADSAIQAVDNGVKSLNIINPQGGVMHMADSDLYVDWQANNLNVDHYYVLLQNELVNDVGLIVGDNITSTSSYLSYHFNLSKKVIDQMVKQSNGLTEGQLQNHYYVTVVAANRVFFGGSKPEYYAKSKVFYIGPTSGVIANNTSSLATPIQNYRGTNSYKYEISFDLYNSSSSPVYLNKNINGDAIAFDITPAQASSSRATIDSIAMAGDTATYYYLMPGVTRKFYVYGVINNGGPAGLIRFVLKNIKARTEYSNVDNLVIDLDQNQTKLFMSVDGLVMNNTATSSSSSIIVGAPTIIGGNKVVSYPIEIKFNIVAQDSPIYISNLINGKTPLVFSDSEGYVIPQMYSVEMSPRDIAGDGILYKMIPAGTTRSFTFRGVVRNSGLKYSNNRIIQVKAIKYGLSSDTVDSEFVNTNYSNLKALVYLSEDYNATTTSEAYDPKSVYIKDGFSRTLKILTSNDYKVIGNNFDLFAYIVNINDYPIYLRNKNDGADIVTSLDPAWAKADVSLSFGNRSPQDPIGYVVINPRSERLIYINGNLYNNEYNGNVKYSVKSIMYGTTTSRLERTIDDGLSYLSYSVPFDSASSTLYSSSVVLNQKINSLSTYSGLPGTSVIAYGQDFCRLVKNVVTFTSDRYDITDDKAVLSGDGKSIRFTVPNMPFGTYKVFVDSKGSSWNSPKCNPSNYLNFTIGSSTAIYSPTPVASVSTTPRSSPTPVPSIASTTVALPYITSISPSRGVENTAVTISGRNLGYVTSVEFYDKYGRSVRGIVPTYVSSQNVSFKISSEFARLVASGMYDVEVVSSACKGGCDSNRLSFELVGTAQASVSPSPSASRSPTPYPSASNTPYPTASNTPTPTYSSTPVPTSGATPTPAISSTPIVSPTPVTSATPVTTPTPVTSTTPIITPTPSASATPTPSSSSTPRPSTSTSPSPSSSPMSFGNEYLRASVWSSLKSLFGI